MTAFDDPVYEYQRCPEQDGASRRHPVVIAGAGPVGLAAAIDLYRHGIPVVLVDEKTTVSDGSRAICWAKRTLEICDRLGVGQPLIDKGVTWNRGNVYLGDEQIYQFDLLPEADHKRPAFINLQQFYFEHYLIQHAQALPEIDMRWQHRVVDAEQGPDSVTLTIDTPDGPYTLETAWLIAADGVRSKVRQSLGKDFEGRVFQDRFLIADISVRRDDPAIRRFWFNPSFHDGQSALMHKQADNVWRIDFQLGPDADPDLENKPEKVIPRIKKMLGDVHFEIVWSSV
ncbi:MAG: FAD-dependent monooxygenase, partial [Alphaproteobacteria bacterium]